MTLKQVARKARYYAWMKACAGALKESREQTDKWAEIGAWIDRWGEKRWGDGWILEEHA